MNIQYELQNFAFLGIAFVILYLAKLVQDALSKKAFDADDQITEKSNLALALRRGGMYLGLAIGLKGALSGSGQGFQTDVAIFALDGVLLVILLGVAKILADKVILPGINNAKEIGRGNIAVGCAEAGLFVATGLIASGSFTGEGAGLVQGLVAAAAFFALGQIALVICSVIVEWATKLDVKSEIANGNASAGILLGASMIALGLILGTAVSGPSQGWGADLALFGYETLKGLVVLFVFGKLADWIFLPHTDIAIETKRDHNSAAILLHSSVIISVALLLVSSVL